MLLSDFKATGPFTDSDQKVITAKALSKHYGKLWAVENLSFEVQANTCFGILGPNGAGKTTLMKMLYGRQTKDFGTIDVFGYDPAVEELAIKYMCGVVSQDNSLDGELNVIDNLMVYARFYALKRDVAKQRISALLDFMELKEKQTARIKTLSGGMQRRLVIARALLNYPKLLILDEPTVGLDPQVRHHIWEKLRQLKALGTTIVLSTHYMEEAFVLCDQVMIMDKGAAVAFGPPKELLNQHIERFVLEVEINSYKSIHENVVAKEIRLEMGAETAHLYSDDMAYLQELTKQLQSAHYYLRPSNLEDLFLKATGRGLND